MLLDHSRTAAACAIACLAAAPANATTITVSPGPNDSQTIQNAVDAAEPGDTLVFRAGNYRLSGVTLKSGVAMQGAAGAVLYNTADQTPIFQLNPKDSHDISITGLRFIGTGKSSGHGSIELNGDSLTSENGANRIAITNCDFHNNGLSWLILKNSVISGNRVSNIGPIGAGIGGYYAQAVRITHNRLTNVYQGISMINSGPDQGADIVVSYNTGSGVSRMAIEIQGQNRENETTNLLVQGNHFINWANPTGKDTIAYSIVTTGTGTQVLDNYAKAGVRTGIGIEISGPGAIAKYNYIDGFAIGIIGYMERDNISYNNVINNSWEKDRFSTFNRTDEIVVGNTSDPDLPIPFSGATSAGTGTPTQAEGN